MEMRPPWLLFSQQTGRAELRMGPHQRMSQTPLDVRRSPSVAASEADAAQRRALDANEHIGVGVEAEQAEDGADDAVVRLAGGVAALDGAGVAVTAAAARGRGAGRRSPLGVCGEGREKISGVVRGSAR